MHQSIQAPFMVRPDPARSDGTLPGLKGPQKRTGRQQTECLGTLPGLMGPGRVPSDLAGCLGTQLAVCQSFSGALSNGVVVLNNITI